ncbi:MAG: hypothetical protein JSU63_05565, partial [Phycisphaerales bacterium]
MRQSIIGSLRRRLHRTPQGRSSCITFVESVHTGKEHRAHSLRSNAIVGIVLLAVSTTASAQLASTTSSTATALTAGSNQRAVNLLTTSVVFETPPHEIITVGDEHEFFADGLGYLLIPGKPKIPSKIRAIAIPPGAELVDVRFETGKGVVLPGTYHVAPAPLPRVIGEEDPEIYARAKARYEDNYNSVYGSDEAYPLQVAEFVRRAGYRHYNLVDMRITPFSYRPLSGTVTHYPEIAVHVDYLLPDRRVEAVADNTLQTKRVAQRYIANYEDTEGWYSPASSATRGLHDFVIITLDSLTSAVTPLVNWETSKGRTVEVVTTSWIDSMYGGYDLVEAIRNFLRDKYPADQWGIQDVLLVGHYDDVPMRRTAQDLGYGRPETDYYYAELSLPDSESWDLDGDHQYGEGVDPIDFYAEVSVGRIPWSDAATVQSICEKSVAYEQNDDPAFKKNMLLLGAFFWEDTDCAELMEAKIDQPWMADWTMTRLYEKNSTVWSWFPCDEPLTHANALSAWTSGTYAFVNIAGHGSPTSTHIMGYNSQAFITSSDCLSLNDDYPAIIFADACSNHDTDYNNIGRAMLKQGAVGFLGSTKVALGGGGWDDPYDGSSQSLDYLFTTAVTSGEYTQGEAHQYALREMYVNGLWDYLKYETFEWGAFAGNPNLRIAPPPALRITFPQDTPEYIEPTVETTFNVQIESIGETYTSGTGLLHYRYDDGAFLTTPLVHVDGDLFEAILPAPECGDTPEFYVSAAGDGGTTMTKPNDAPTTAYSADVGTFIPVWENTLDTDPGWTTEGDWAYGQPTGGGGEYGSPDPTSGYTGANVYGYNLYGDYPNDMSQQHLTSTAIDCTGLSGVHLRFRRWLGVEKSTYDHAYILVDDGAGRWATMWQNTVGVEDASWTYVDVDISTKADDEPTVYLRWTMGASDGGWRYCGWNIDDIELHAFVCIGDPSCDDGVENQGEDRVDCGGPCAPCECTADAQCDDSDPCTGVEPCNRLGVCTRLLSADCNLNELEDSCDIGSGASGDCQGNGIPDDCEIQPPAAAS